MNRITVQGKQNFMGHEIPVVAGGFREGSKCISDKAIAEIHGMEIKHVRELINRNIKRFKVSIDLMDLKEVVQDDYNLLDNIGYSQMQISKAEHIYILSERGYAKLIKIMDTDKAWEVHDNLMDEYFQMKYGPISTIDLMELQIKAIKENQAKIEAVNNDLQEFKQEMPLLGVEEGKITNAVHRKGVDCLGGKHSAAYGDNSVRSKVYSDIHKQLKREFDVTTYKAIKRNQCDLAIQIIRAYEMPYVLSERVKQLNQQIGLREN